MQQYGSCTDPARVTYTAEPEPGPRLGRRRRPDGTLLWRARHEHPTNVYPTSRPVSAGVRGATDVECQRRIVGTPVFDLLR